jgi:ABC-type branched-subunit amino acid transport system substrate-binding protein
VRIGQSLPMTGPLRAVVQPIAEGQQALLRSVNAQGGVNGAPIELITLDDGADPARTLENTRALLDQHNVAALFGYAFVPGLVRTLPLLDERRVPLLGIYNGADIVRSDARPWLFTTTASLRDEIGAMVQTLATLDTRKLVVAYQNNELGRFMLPQVEALAAQHRVTLLAKVPLEPDGSNAKDASLAVSAASPQAVLLLAGGAAVLGFMKSLPASARVPVYALSLAGTTALVEQLGTGRPRHGLHAGGALSAAAHHAAHAQVRRGHDGGNGLARPTTACGVTSMRPSLWRSCGAADRGPRRPPCRRRWNA